MHLVTRASLAFCLSFVIAFTMASCTATMQYKDARDLGPDTPEKTESVKASNLVDKLKYQVNWLWASYTRLKSKVNPAIESMKELYVNAQEMLVSIKRSDLVNAITYFNKAKANIVTITKGEVE